MIAVSPDYQRKGIATQLTNFAIDWMKKSGITVVMVEKGSDPGQLPARKAYEKLGFNVVPISRYYKKNLKGRHNKNVYKITPWLIDFSMFPDCLLKRVFFLQFV